MNCFCGIADMRGESFNFERLRSMKSAMIQRKGARAEAYIEKSVGLLCSQELPLVLGETSLPYLTPLKNGTLAVAFDGELHALSDTLRVRSLGADIARELAECYLSFGCDAPLEIEGEISFVAIDSGCRELFLSVDAECSHPIFLHKDNERLVFSNSIRPLLSYSPRAAEVDKAAILELLCAPAGEVLAEDIYKNISTLKGGHFMVFSGLGESICEYASRKRTLSAKKVCHGEKKLITLLPSRIADPKSAAEEMLFCFDYPEFDEYLPEYLSAIHTLKDQSISSHVFIEEISPHVSESFAKLKADRIGSAFGLRISPKFQCKKPPRSRALLSEREKKLSAEVRSILSSPQSHTKRLFGSSLDALLSRECDVASKVRTLGKIIGLERWLESYPIIPT